MPTVNFARMMALVTDTFNALNNPEQLDVNEDVIIRLKQLHPATLSEHNDSHGPVIWILLIPTTVTLMTQFTTGEISETELLYKTPLHTKYDALYLCSASTLTEYRAKGLTKQIALTAIKKIRTNHPIKFLFVWNFSKTGARLAESIAIHEKLPLMKRDAKFYEE